MNRVVVVTGGSRGIGIGISQAVIAQDPQVSVVATHPGPEGLVNELGGPDKAAYFQARVEDVDSHSTLIADIVARFGRIDVSPATPASPPRNAASCSRPRPRVMTQARQCTAR